MSVEKNASLKPYSYYGIGGSCEVLYLPESLAELIDALKQIRECKLPMFVLGVGANSLISDEHWNGAVINLNNLKHVEFGENSVIAQAGVTTDELTQRCLESNMGGLSWMHSLPGNVGGTVFMNARCFGGEMSKVVNTVKAVTEDGVIKQYSASEAFLGYKNTVFMTNDEIIYEVTFNVQKDDHDKILIEMKSHRAEREFIGHFLYPSCGCVFKNNYEVGISSGFILDELGAKELKLGGAEVSNHQANFIYNKANATATDILSLSFMMRELVYKELGVWLEYEMRLLGRFSKDITQKFYEQRPNNYNVDKIDILKKRFESRKEVLT